MNTTKNRSIRLAGLVLAVLATATINGTMLWKFDDVARQATLARSAQTPTVVTLVRANSSAPRS